MNTTLTIDKGGRVVIPKPLRDELRLAPGDELQLDSEGDHITLRPVRAKAILKKKQGIWVFGGESSDIDIADFIDREREKRINGFFEAE